MEAAAYTIIGAVGGTLAGIVVGYIWFSRSVGRVLRRNIDWLEQDRQFFKDQADFYRKKAQDFGYRPVVLWPTPPHDFPTDAPSVDGKRDRV